MRLPKDFGFFCLVFGACAAVIIVPVAVFATRPGTCYWNADEPIKYGRIWTEGGGLFSSGVTAHYVIRPGHRENGDKCEARTRVTESEYERLIYER